MMLEQVHICQDLVQHIANLAGTKQVFKPSRWCSKHFTNNSAKLATSDPGIDVTGTININSAYTLITADGSANPSINNKW